MPGALTDLDDVEYVDIPIFCGPVIKREISKGICSSYLDVTYVDNAPVENIPLHALVFQNYYTASISISHMGPSNTPIYILEDKMLMENAYFEKDGNKCCEVYASELNNQFVHRKSFRINLFQPSNTWANFEIKKVKAVGIVQKSAGVLNSDTGGSGAQNNTALLKSDGSTILNMMRRTLAAAASTNAS
jgi:uncharacterized protein YkuJ